MSSAYVAASTAEPTKTTQLPSQAGREMGVDRPRSPSGCGGAGESGGEPVVGEWVSSGGAVEPASGAEAVGAGTPTVLVSSVETTPGRSGAVSRHASRAPSTASRTTTA